MIKQKKKAPKKKASKTLSLAPPIVVPGQKVSRPDGFPVEEYSYSMMMLFTTNPIMWRVKYINHDVIDTTRSATSVLGQAVHHGLATFLGGNDAYPVPNDDGEALKIALDATMDFLNKYPDGFIDWKANVANREALERLALKAIPSYIKEWDRGHIKDVITVEEKLKGSMKVKVGSREIELPVPIVGYTDLVYRCYEDLIHIVDHKTVFQYTNPDSVDGAKLLQAGTYYFLVYALTGQAPYDFVFREHKISQNKDGSSQTREYQIIYENMPIVFDLFFRLYSDITESILGGKQVYVPNLMAMYDRDIALLTYVYRLDEPDVLEKEMKKNKVEDIADLMKKKMSKSANLKKFMEAKANLFTSHITLNYETMEPQEKIKYKLMEHGMSVNFSDKVEGPSVDLYRFEPSVGIKMTTMEKYQKDIEQVLATAGVRILAPIPGTNFVGIEVPKKKRNFIDISTIRKASSLEIPFGVDVYGKRMDIDIRQMPHLLIAGTTGSGKSVFLHSFITQLTRLPLHEVRLALLDPKMVELSKFQDSKHVDFYADQPEEILSTLNHYADEMETRYKAFKKNKVRSLDEYREKVKKDIPYVVVVIDEFGDLILRGGAHSNAIKDLMIVLAQKGRAAGIHLIITTQRPSAKIVDGLIKANFPTRIAFKTTSRKDSEIILDRIGAEVLLGKGDMLVLGVESDLHRLQGYKVD